jgi:hypothetical protein
VLKKAGIITAGVAASLVAVSPLAFAGEGSHGHHEAKGAPGKIGVIDNGGSSAASGLVAVNALNNADVLKNVAVCPPVDVNAIVSVLGILGGGPNGIDDAPQSGMCAAGDTSSIDQ